MVQARLVLRSHLGVFSEIDFAAVDRLDARAGLLLDRIARVAQFRYAAHDAVVGNRHGGHAQVGGSTHHVLDLGCAVEHGILGVVVEVNECHSVLAP